jgi:uncharacterized protein
MNRAEVITRLKATEPALRAYGVGALYLFGSYARDEARADSDVDVFVDPAIDAFYSFSNFMGASDVLRQTFPDVEIDYGTRDGIVRFYRPHIEQEAVRVF